MNTITANTHRASIHPLDTIERLPRKASQSPRLRMYQSGYEHFFETIPVLAEHDPLLPLKTSIATQVMVALGHALRTDAGSWLHDLPGAGEFQRYILGIEEPQLDLGQAEEMAGLAQYANAGRPDGLKLHQALARALVSEDWKASDIGQIPLKEGGEVVVAHWGAGFQSPVHGHAPGFLHEEVLLGKVLVNSFRRVHGSTARPTRSDLHGPGQIISSFVPPTGDHKRLSTIHNFVAHTAAATLHYLPEHTRDGRDNMFFVERFGLGELEVDQITSDAGIRMQPGDVALVRSANVPDYGDHYIVITGPVIMKDHGLRPQDVAIAAPEQKALLDQFTPQRGLTLLKLSPVTAKRFLDFHGIVKVGAAIAFPEA